MQKGVNTILLIHIYVLLLLFLSGLEDLCTRKVSLSYLLLFLLGAFIIGIFYQHTSWAFMVGGMMMGICIVSLRFLGIQMLGAGDGMVLLITGIVLGFGNNMELLMTGLLLASLYGIVKCLKDGLRSKKEIPFIPFLFLGYLIQVFWNGGKCG